MRYTVFRFKNRYQVNEIVGPFPYTEMVLLLCWENFLFLRGFGLHSIPRYSIIKRYIVLNIVQKKAGRVLH